MAGTPEIPQTPNPRLSVVEFSVTSDPLVGFSCGDQEWHKELNEWISTDAVFETMSKWNTRVWIYYHGNEVVGFGSLGETKRPPPPQGPNRRFSIIPYFAVDSRFHGHPLGSSRDERFAGQIMNNLIYEARKLGLPQLILYVHPKNLQAKSFYTKFGFINEGEVRGGHELMGLRLS